jgi:hypothetical protein
MVGAAQRGGRTVVSAAQPKITTRIAPPREPVHRITATIREQDGSFTQHTVVIPVTE